MNDKENKTPTSQPAIAPLSSEIGKGWQPHNESISHRSGDMGNNTVRNSHPAPGNPNRDQGGSNKDSK